MPTVFIKPITNFCKNKNISYYISLIAKETEAKLAPNALKNFSNSHSCCKNKKQINLFIEGNCLDTFTNDIEILFPQGNPEYKRLADILKITLGNIYNRPSKIKALSTPQNEFQKITIKFNFSNNKNTLAWIKENIENTSSAIIVALTEYFGVPFVPYLQHKYGSSKTDAVILNRPNNKAKIIQTAIPGEKIKILSQWEDWYIVKKGNVLGYIHSKFINI